MWIGSPSSSSSSNAFIEAFWIIRLVIAMYSGVLNFPSFCNLISSFIFLASEDKNMMPSIDTLPRSE